ncbi:MAG: hypothetical protein KDA66_18385 [Planctomycetaceae bacterium]|nr:hypothetical protein [Planctomycetaceae bacterium]
MRVGCRILGGLLVALLVGCETGNPEQPTARTVPDDAVQDGEKSSNGRICVPNVSYDPFPENPQWQRCTPTFFTHFADAVTPDNPPILEMAVWHPTPEGILLSLRNAGSDPLYVRSEWLNYWEMVECRVRQRDSISWRVLHHHRWTIQPIYGVCPAMDPVPFFQGEELYRRPRFPLTASPLISDPQSVSEGHRVAFSENLRSYAWPGELIGELEVQFVIRVDTATKLERYAGDSWEIETPVLRLTAGEAAEVIAASSRRVEDVPSFEVPPLVPKAFLPEQSQPGQPIQIKILTDDCLR